MLANKERMEGDGEKGKTKRSPQKCRAYTK